ncbi:MAG: phage tail sheath C-terminal domain-containing protein [Gemmataceae bacterium]
MVMAGIQDFTDPKRVAQIYSDVIGHCARMSGRTCGRIGFGQVPPSGTVQQWAELTDQLVSERFVLLAPNGIAGAVAGLVGRLDYFQSPTFKSIVGTPDLSRKLYVEEQEALLKAKLVPVATMRGRGTVVVRGLTTDGDQISVRRVADRAVRGMKLIGDLFIGRLNSEAGRAALREKLIEFLVQMERDGAIVPSTDGRDPAFKVNVYSSQDDFVKGIVRVDMAVRPVRAIDYIYATVLVQN